jgi:shikimate dehydrogenase
MQLFGLIGFPVSHSFSARYFAEKFSNEEISNTEYRLFPLEDISQLPTLIENNHELQGFNVTIPHKVGILPYLDQVTPEAAEVGAVNCVKISRNISGIQLIGYNTDAFGFRESSIPFLKPHHKNALVLGTGGASKAVCYSLKSLNIHYTLVSRSPGKSDVIQYNQITEKIIHDNLLIINTTPLGQFPDIEACPEIPYKFLSNKHLLFDLIYNPVRTQFLEKGLGYDASILNGQQMLQLQAEKSWEIWNS